MSSLSTSQRLILATAADRADGAVLPMPDGFSVRGRARQLMIEGLIKRGLIAGRPARDDEPAWAQGDGDCTLRREPAGEASHQVIITCAASNNATVLGGSPDLVMAPRRSVSPDW